MAVVVAAGPFPGHPVGCLVGVQRGLDLCRVKVLVRPILHAWVVLGLPHPSTHAIATAAAAAAILAAAVARSLADAKVDAVAAAVLQAALPLLGGSRTVGASLHDALHSGVCAFGQSQAQAQATDAVSAVGALQVPPQRHSLCACRHRSAVVGKHVVDVNVANLRVGRSAKRVAQLNVALGLVVRRVWIQRVGFCKVAVPQDAVVCCVRDHRMGPPVVDRPAVVQLSVRPGVSKREALKVDDGRIVAVLAALLHVVLYDLSRELRYIMACVGFSRQPQRAVGKVRKSL
mmetsp:Transcript_19614/g.58165  ORF Transcript_19614/g.58165 Transcript_19614/m.58165 type:complete len:288 (+) Transcript_19614:1024-1887(+)